MLSEVLKAEAGSDEASSALKEGLDFLLQIGVLRIVAVIFPDTESTDRRRLTDDLPPTVEQPTLNVVTVFNLYFNGTTWDAALMLDAGSAAWRPTGRFRTWLQSHKFEWTTALHKQEGLNRFVRGLCDEVCPCHAMRVLASQAEKDHTHGRTTGKRS